MGFFMAGLLDRHLSNYKLLAPGFIICAESPLIQSPWKAIYGTKKGSPSWRPSIIISNTSFQLFQPPRNEDRVKDLMRFHISDVSTKWAIFPE